MTKLSQAHQSSQLKLDLSEARYLVAFISRLKPESNGYQEAAEQMIEAVKQQPGFVAAYSAREIDSVGITNSYWRDIEAIEAWKNEPSHQRIQQQGKQHWYHWYQLQVCEIIRQS